MVLALPSENKCSKIAVYFLPNKAKVRRNTSGLSRIFNEGRHKIHSNICNSYLQKGVHYATNI